MRNKFSDVFYELGKEDERLSLVVADISPAGSITRFREEFPDRFINTGVAEQIMIGMAAGMAQRGMRPFAYTIATFALYRPFEFVRNDICYQELPITIVGIGGGVTYSTLGATHHAMEDIGIASSIPNMSVIAPCDPLETEAATRWCATQNNGPVYLRLGKAGEPDLTSKADEGWEYGKLRAIQKDEGDVAIVYYGPIGAKAVELARALRDKGNKVALFNCHTIKPIDVERLRHVLSNHKKVLVMEETTTTGSVSSLIKGIMVDYDIRCKISNFTLKDEFIHCYGTHMDILNEHGLARWYEEQLK